MRRVLLTIFLVLISSLVFPGYALAAGLQDGKVVFGGEYTLHSGEILVGDLVVFGGKVQLKDGSIVTGNVAMLGGTLVSSGDVNGDVVAIGNKLVLKDDSIIDGKLVLIGANMTREGQAIVGEVLHFDSPGAINLQLPDHIQLARISGPLGDIPRLVKFLVNVFLWSALAILVTLFFPKSLERIRLAAVKRPFASGSMGFLTGLVAVPVVLLLAITLILIPLSLIGLILLGCAYILGVVALGMDTGKRMGGLVNQDWSDGIASGLGTFVLIFVTQGTAALVPCVGWMLPALVGCLGVGAVVLTRFGSTAY